MRALSVIGTRPEGIKLVPVIRALAGCADVRSIVCLTGQHEEMLSPVLSLFGVEPDHDLRVGRAKPSLNDLLAAIVAGIDEIIGRERPDWVIVQGDTTSALAGALAAFHRGVPVAHVEAGLRTGDLAQPWPEEMNRRTIDGLSALLFAPTWQAKANLLRETVPGRVLVTGNTGIDALQACAARLDGDSALRQRLDAALPTLDPRRRLLLVTGHRRENLGEGLAGVCEALLRLDRRDDLEIVLPVHMNPAVAGPVRQALQGRPHVHLTPPQDYPGFIRLLQRACVVLTDSGGVQEEAPALGRPVLVTRAVTERPEGGWSGAARLVGTDPEGIEREVSRLLDDPAAYDAMAIRRSPYGDGRAAGRIADALRGRGFAEWSAAAPEAADLASFAAARRAV